MFVIFGFVGGLRMSVEIVIDNCVSVSRASFRALSISCLNFHRLL